MRARREQRGSGSLRQGLGVLLGAGLLASCVLRNTSEPPHYFSPTLEGGAVAGAPGGTARDAPVASEGAIPLRLARVRAASYLGERIVWRSSDVELGLYEQRRWTEPPADLFEQALARSLFEGAGLRRSESGVVASLGVKLLAFDEVLSPRHEAAIRASVLLLDAHQIPLIDRELAASAPISGDGGDAVARAMGTALEQITGEIATDVRSSLAGAAAAEAAKAKAPVKSRRAR